MKNAFFDILCLTNKNIAWLYEQPQYNVQCFKDCIDDIMSFFRQGLPVRAYKSDFDTRMLRNTMRIWGFPDKDETIKIENLDFYANSATLIGNKIRKEALFHYQIEGEYSPYQNNDEEEPSDVNGGIIFPF